MSNCPLTGLPCPPCSGTGRPREYVTDAARAAWHALSDAATTVDAYAATMTPLARRVVYGRLMQAVWVLRRAGRPSTRPRRATEAPLTMPPNRCRLTGRVLIQARDSGRRRVYYDDDARRAASPVYRLASAIAPLAGTMTPEARGALIGQLMQMAWVLRRRPFQSPPVPVCAAPADVACASRCCPPRI
ncbi:MAG: hypothetical protein R3F65_23700 [bacterium]